jgi:glycosyltransferase involved in cell wall biosynthesis
MKIIHIFPYTARNSGGHSNAILAFIECQLAAGLDVCALSPISAGVGANGRSLPPEIREIEFASCAAVGGAIERLADGRRAIVHVHAINRFTTALVAHVRGAGHAVALTSHGQLNFRSPLHALKKFVYLSLCRSPVRYANGIHVLTSKEQQSLRFLIPGYKGKIVILPHIIRGASAGGDVGNARELDKPTGEGVFTIVHLGRLEVVTKGLDLLVEGFAKAGLGQARLVLAGPDWGHERASLERLARDYGCSQRVFFPGAVYGADKERLLASADLFVAASRWDAFNISLADLPLPLASSPTIPCGGRHLPPPEKFGLSRIAVVRGWVRGLSHFMKACCSKVIF